MLLCDALLLGALACVLGLALGQELSVHLFHSNPAFLSLAFALGSERAVSVQSVALATAGGMLAAIVAVLSPLRDIVSEDPLAAVRVPEGSPDAYPGVGGPSGAFCLAAASAILIAFPEAAIPGMALLLGALLLELPIVLSTTLALTRRLARTLVSVVPHVAAMELATARARAVAVAARPVRSRSSAASRSRAHTATC